LAPIQKKKTKEKFTKNDVFEEDEGTKAAREMEKN
jgi:hypothetical protein